MSDYGANKMNQRVEVIRVRVSEENADEFVRRRPAVDADVRALAGCLGSQVIHVVGDEWLVLVYWDSQETVEAAQQITAGMTIITDWLKLASQFISFHTGELRYTSLG
jgi:quinol monooxygenase YgiN